MAFKMKGFEPHNMYKTKKANTHKDHLDLEKKGYDHNPYKKVSSFTKTKETNLPEEEQQRITDKKKEKPELLPSENPDIELTTKNDRIQERIVNLEQRIEFIGETINASGDRATKQQRDDLAKLHKEEVALRKQQKKNK